MTNEAATIYTIGHSRHTRERLLDLLTVHGIEIVADVRSLPYSRRNPQFNREPFANALAAHGMGYLYLGTELGARTTDPECYVDGRVQYDRLAQRSSFRAGIEQLRAAARMHRVAVLCAEKEPAECHRSMLVARELSSRGHTVIHILEDGSLEDHDGLLLRLARRWRLQPDLISGREQVFEEVYRRQAGRIAYRQPSERHPIAPL